MLSAFLLEDICLGALRNLGVIVGLGAWIVQTASPTCDQSRALAGQRKQPAKEGIR
jgi:hypothetical protein